MTRDKRLSAEWPPPLPKDHPTSVAWRVDQLERVADCHHDRWENHDARIGQLEALTAQPSSPSMATALPWLRVGGLILVLGLGIKGHLSPDTMQAILLKLLGV